MHRSTVLILVLWLGACAGSPSLPDEPPPSMPTLDSIVAAPDRTDADRALDEGRKPLELLRFLGLRMGMRAADLGAGGGYTTELLARAVGPTGVVYGQNSQLILDRFAQKPWTERLERPVMRNVRRVDQPFDDPLPAEAKDLDLVVMVLFYHDTVWMGVDRARMNQAIAAHLRRGGAFVVVDHSGREGTGTTETQTLHRIEEAVVRQEVQAAGLKLQESADFLRNPSDPRDWNDSPRAAADRRGTSDRFVLRFVKP